VLTSPNKDGSMQENDPVPATEMVRIPGLYRRWELPEILKNHHAFRIEDAGAHQDGTPLVAIYAAADVPNRAAGSISRGRDDFAAA
jgi:hypothetical protein